MKTLFDILDGILSSAEKDEYLSSPDSIISYAELTIGISIDKDFAESIIRVGKHWLDQRQNGDGEWSRMREEAKASLVCYQHLQSGDVATAEMWKSDFDAMDVESWFGLPAEECTELHWLSDSNSLVEVEFDTDSKEWIEV